MDQFDEWHRKDFRNSSLGYLADVPDIQFSAQLIQQLVLRTIGIDKLYELWFSVQGHLMRFDLQEYALVTGLRCGAFPDGAEFDRLLETRRLKERVGYRRLLHEFRGTCTKKFQKAKRRKEKEITYTVHGFPIAIQVWMYEVLPEVGEHFFERVGERLPRLLRWSTRKQPQHRTYDVFFKNVKLHMYATLRPTDAEAQQPYFSTLVLYDEPPFNVSGGDGRAIRHVEREDSEEEASEGGRSEQQTYGGHKEKGASGSDPDSEDSKDIGEVHGKGSSVGEDTRGGARGTSSSLRPPGDVEELLLDQRILFEMRLRTVKLEIQQHVTLECTSLREFLATLVARACPTTAEPTTRAETEAGISGSLPEDVYGGPAEPCPYESDIAIDTGNMQDAAHIAPTQDDLNLPVPTVSEEVQDAGATEPSNDVGDDDDEADGCDATDGDDVVTEVPALEPVLEARAEVPTTRQHSARL
ncbi:Hypothetical predicted protein [Olea europaea subsp. europaea]|uniref:DUF1985 domain-containing protein n=1 Tax=Olea europaea subsp. europaea TaxID=158383 RepID=A0A8S0VFJ3_OLEEU|nr:Hypothetical predicted protein [Olea europaea subsp. europaea]